jgi:hypothetical protein
MMIVVASLLLAMTVYAANFALWADKEVVDSDAFVESAMESFTREGSYRALAEIMTEKVVAKYPSLTLLEPTLLSMFSGLVATSPFEPALEDVSLQIHTAVIGGTPAPIVLDIGEYRDLVVSAVSLVSPSLAERLPDELFSTFQVFDQGELPDVSSAATRAAAFGWISLGMAIVLAVLLMLVLGSAARWLIACGSALVLGALATAAIIPLARASANSAVENIAYRVLGTNLYDSLVTSLAFRTWILGVVGVAFLGIGMVAVISQRRAD